MNKIHFIKAGHQPPKHKSNPAGILHLISDWVLTSDFHNNYVFLFEITVAELHPEIVIFPKHIDVLFYLSSLATMKKIWSIGI